MRRSSLILAGVAVMAPLLAAGPAQAGCKASDGCHCTLTASGVNFGTYEKARTTLGAGDVQIRCGAARSPVNLSYEIRLSTGISNSYANRRLMFGAAYLQYNLYRNTSRTSIWGNGTAGTATVSGILHIKNGYEESKTHSVYGLLPANQNVAAGIYLDTIVVTVIF